mgnify:CR=1 FL=1
MVKGCLSFNNAHSRMEASPTRRRVHILPQLGDISKTVSTLAYLRSRRQSMFGAARDRCA